MGVRSMNAEKMLKASRILMSAMRLAHFIKLGAPKNPIEDELKLLERRIQQFKSNESLNETDDQIQHSLNFVGWSTLESIVAYFGEEALLEAIEEYKKEQAELDKVAEKYFGKSQSV
jgi:hypothetical protein